MAKKEISLQPYCEPGRLEAGCDEAGRGPLAGPVYAAAVILPPDFHHPLLNDSKQMTEKERDELRPIIEAEAVAWAVEAVQADEIDQLNILWASVTGMQRAVLRLDPAPDFLLVDGNKFRPFGRYGFKDFRTVVHGDATFASIAAASVLAKTYIGPGQDLPGRVHAEDRPRLPGIRLGPQHGLSHARAHRRHPASRVHALAPEVLPCEGVGTDFVLMGNNCKFAY